LAGGLHQLRPADLDDPLHGQELWVHGSGAAEFATHAPQRIDQRLLAVDQTIGGRPGRLSKALGVSEPLALLLELVLLAELGV
jgi:hypothetical protein